MRNALKLAAIAALGYIGSQQQSVAAVIYGYSDANNHLIRFDSATPGTLTLDTALTGLAAADILYGIDFRPSTGVLYGIAASTTTGRVITINPATGAVTYIGAGFTINPSDSFGMDFDPVADAIRLIGAGDTNIRINPTTGALISTDSTINPGTPAVTHIAYTNSAFGPAPATAALYALDAFTDSLYTVNPANGGTLSLVGAAGLNVSGFGGFDIDGATGVAYASFRLNGVSTLYSINLATGAASAIGAINNPNGAVDGLSVAPAASNVPEPSSFALIAFGIGALAVRARRR